MTLSKNDVVELVGYGRGGREVLTGQYDVVEQVVGEVAFLRYAGRADLRDLRAAPAHVWDAVRGGMQMTRRVWEAKVIALEPHARQSIECSSMDDDYDNGMTPDEAVCEWRRRRATGLADRRNGC